MWSKLVNNKASSKNYILITFEATKSHMSPFRRILQFAKPYRIYFVLSIVFNVLYSLMAIVSITSILPILKILFDNVKKEDLGEEDLP